MVVELSSLVGIGVAGGIERTGMVDLVGEAVWVVALGTIVAQGIVPVVDKKTESGMVVGTVVAFLDTIAVLEKIQGALLSPVRASSHSQAVEEDKLDTYWQPPVPYFP